MPTYEYVCKCGEQRIISKPMSEAATTEYCECSEQQPMERIWTPSLLEVKGGTPRFHRRSSK